MEEETGAAAEEAIPAAAAVDTAAPIGGAESRGVASIGEGDPGALEAMELGRCGGRTRVRRDEIWRRRKLGLQRMEAWPRRRRGDRFYSENAEICATAPERNFRHASRDHAVMEGSFSRTHHFLRGKTQTSPRIQRCPSTRSSESDGPVKSPDACQ